MLDNRIGRYDGEEPEVCAVSGELVRGRPSSQYPLDKQHYYRVLAKREGDFSWREAKEEELKAVISGAVTSETAPKAFPDMPAAPARTIRAPKDGES